MPIDEFQKQAVNKTTIDTEADITAELVAEVVIAVTTDDREMDIDVSIGENLVKECVLE
jgi:hypothetical protein